MEMAHNPVGFHEWFCLYNRADSVPIPEINGYTATIDLFSGSSSFGIYNPKVFLEEKAKEKLWRWRLWLPLNHFDK
jgi:hypothetical protein